MGVLPVDLIKQFVKQTNDTNEDINDNPIYGTVEIIDDQIFVKIDGSDIATPVSTTANVVDGDRVVVEIKNHSATIVGNITSPAARNDDVESAGKTATNFIDFGNYGPGLTIGDMRSSGELGKNTYIDADGVAIRNGKEEIARFGESIRLGKKDDGNYLVIDPSGGEDGTEYLSLHASNDTRSCGISARIYPDRSEFDPGISEINMESNVVNVTTPDGKPGSILLGDYCVPIMLYGQTSISHSSSQAGSVRSISVSFENEYGDPISFPYAPTVLVNAHTSTPNSVHVSASNVTKSGFTIYLYRGSVSGSSQSTTISWCAMCTPPLT